MSESNVVSFERDLAGPDSDSTTGGAVEVRAGEQLARVAAPEALGERRLVGPLERADRGQPVRRRAAPPSSARSRG